MTHVSADSTQLQNILPHPAFLQVKSISHHVRICGNVAYYRFKG